MKRMLRPKSFSSCSGEQKQYRLSALNDEVTSNPHLRRRGRCLVVYGNLYCRSVVRASSSSSAAGSLGKYRI